MPTSRSIIITITLITHLTLQAWDKQVSTFLLKQAVGGAESKDTKSHQSYGEMGPSAGRREWDLNKLRQYIGDNEDDVVCEI